MNVVASAVFPLDNTLLASYLVALLMARKADLEISDVVNRTPLAVAVLFN